MAYGPGFLPARGNRADPENRTAFS